MKTILIIEDSDRWLDMYIKRVPPNTANILTADTLAKGEKLFLENPNPDLIVMDGCVDDPDHLDSLPLIAKIRETYTGDMVAGSSSSTYRKRMLEAGCNIEADKGDVRPVIHAKLGI